MEYKFPPMETFPNSKFQQTKISIKKIFIPLDDKDIHKHLKYPKLITGSSTNPDIACCEISQGKFYL